MATLSLPTLSTSSHMEINLQSQSSQQDKEVKLDRGTCVTERISDSQVKFMVELFLKF